MNLPCIDKRLIAALDRQGCAETQREIELVGLVVESYAEPIVQRHLRFAVAIRRN